MNWLKGRHIEFKKQVTQQLGLYLLARLVKISIVKGCKGINIFSMKNVSKTLWTVSQKMLNYAFKLLRE